MRRQYSSLENLGWFKSRAQEGYEVEWLSNQRCNVSYSNSVGSIIECILYVWGTIPWEIMYIQFFYFSHIRQKHEILLRLVYKNEYL